MPLHQELFQVMENSEVKSFVIILANKKIVIAIKCVLTANHRMTISVKIIVMRIIVSVGLPVSPSYENTELSSVFITFVKF